MDHHSWVSLKDLVYRLEGHRPYSKMGQTPSKRISKTSTVSSSNLLGESPTVTEPPTPQSSTFSNSVVQTAYTSSPESQQSIELSDIAPTPKSQQIIEVLDITPPAPRRELNRLSDILDPIDILEDAYHPVVDMPSKTPDARTILGVRTLVQSPSGNALGVNEFIAHPNRPLAMWERRERVKAATMDGLERLNVDSRAETRTGYRDKKAEKYIKNVASGKKRRGCCGWW